MITDNIVSVFYSSKPYNNTADYFKLQYCYFSPNTSYGLSKGNKWV